MDVRFPCYSSSMLKTRLGVAAAPAQILARLRRRGAGSVVLSSDFLDIASRRAVDTALHRLSRAKRVQRLARGIYYLPQTHVRFGPRPPSLDAIVLAIARRTGSRVQVAGAEALNRLGLSTQVPARVTFVTDGPTRRLVVGERTVELRHVSSRRLVAPGTPVGLTVQALYELGARGITDEVVTRLRNALSEGDLRSLRLRARRLPAWQQAVVRRLTATS